jgi:hypothetical protein
MGDLIRCSSCDATVERAFVHAGRIRARCSSCALQFDVRCVDCRGAVRDAVEDAREIVGRCIACGRGLRIDAPVADSPRPPERVVERSERIKPGTISSPETSREGMVVTMHDDTRAAATYRGQPVPGTLTVSVEDRGHQRRWSAYLSARAEHERVRAVERRWAWVGFTTTGILSLLFLFLGHFDLSLAMASSVVVGVASIAVLRAKLQSPGFRALLNLSPAAAEPAPPRLRGGGARVSTAGIEVRDASGRWQRPIEPGPACRVRVEPGPAGYAVRVETERHGVVTLVEGLPEPADATEIADRIGAHLMKARSSGG